MHNAHIIIIREDIFKEIEILMKVDHPNVMYMKECFIATDKVVGECRWRCACVSQDHIHTHLCARCIFCTTFFVL